MSRDLGKAEDNGVVIIAHILGKVKEETYMKKVILNALVIENFKGITNLALEVNGAGCTVYGDNATGKSSVCDAWHWLLFGKNRYGDASFAIKPLDADGNVRDSGAVTSVTAEISVNGTVYELRRTYYEKWSQKRGSAEKTFDGNTSDFYIDGIPMKKGEYEGRIRDLIADEDVFTLITGLYAFNEGLNMQNRRKVLYEMCGVRSDAELIAGSEKFSPLAGVLEKYTVEEYKKKLVSERRTLNAEKLKIPARIDECVKLAADLRETDYDALGAELVELEAERDGLNGELVRIKNDNAVQVKESELTAVRGEAENLEMRNRLHRQSQANTSDAAKVDAWKLRLSSAETEERMLVGRISSAEVRAERLERQIEEKRAVWRQIADEPFTAPEACPTCGRAFDGDSLRAAENEFAVRKNERLGEVAAQAKWMKDDLADVRKELDELREDAKKVSAELADIRASEPVVQEVIVTDLPGYDDERCRLTDRIAALEAEIAELKNGTAHTRTLLTEKLTGVRREIERVNGELAKKTVLASTEARIEELRQAERTLTGQLGDNDRMQYLCEEFVRYKVSFIEDSVNSRFRMAKFKLFDVQVNGALVDCCEATYNGVPYAAVNHGTAVNLGLDIVETLSEYYGVTAPLFIDNAESVTRLLPSDVQVIRLVVSEEDKELRIENGGKRNELEAAS